jgi:enoyl-CoA hydratase/carnithine racemase
MADRSGLGPLVTYERVGALVFVELAREDKLNAFSREMTTQFHDAMSRFDADDDASVAVVSGRGRAFSSGLDTKEPGLAPPRAGAARVRNVGPAQALLQAATFKPVVCATHGYTLGAGLSLALAADLVVAGEDTRFQVTEVGRGMQATTFWAQLIDRGAGALAADVCLTGRFFTAQEAFDHSLVAVVAPEGTHVERATEIAEQVAAQPQTALRWTVRARRLRFAQTQMESHALVDEASQDPAGDAEAG